MVSLRCVPAFAAAAMFLVPSTAFAGRGFVIDTGVGQLTPCDLGDTFCAASFFTPLGGPMYVYAEGIVSFGNPLTGIDLASIQAQDTDWFAGAFSGTQYQTFGVQTFSYGAEAGWAINYYAQGTSVSLPDQFGQGGTTPLFQIQVLPHDYGDFGDNGEDVSVVFSGNPGDGSFIGYATDDGSSDGVTIDNTLDLQNSDFTLVTQAGSLAPASSFSIVRSTASPTPEPATWASMLLGFGVVGGALRYRKTAKAIA